MSQSEEKPRAARKCWINTNDGGLALRKEDLDHSNWVARVHAGWELAERFLRERGFDTRELDGLLNPSTIDEFYSSNLLFTTPTWVEASKELIVERAVLVERVKELAHRLENLLEDGAISYGPDTDLIRSWPKEVIVEAYTIGRVLSHSPTLRHLAGYLGPQRGGSRKVIDEPETREALAREYGLLRDTEKYGDKSDKTLWQVICDRYDNNPENEKWRGHAKVDCGDVPTSVLDLVPKRGRFKPKLRPSDLALLHAATRAKIDFKISSSNGMLKVKDPSLRTLRRAVEDTEA